MRRALGKGPGASAEVEGCHPWPLQTWVADPPQAPPREAPAFLFWQRLSGILSAQAQLARELTMPSQRASPGWSPAASSVRPSWAEGRKTGYSCEKLWL